MYPKLSYLYFLSILVVGLVSSCASDTPDAAPDIDNLEKGPELSFTTSDLTRATTTSIDKFAVYGDMRFRADANNDPLVIFNKTEVRYIDNNWRYEGTQHWYSNHEHSFVAVNPVSVLETGAPRYSGSGLTFTYTIPTTSGAIANKDAVSDILVATHRRWYEEKKDGSGKFLPEPGVRLKFSHIMSLVNVALALDDALMKKDEFVLVQKMEFSGIRTTASFNILPANRASDNQTDNSEVKVTGHTGDAKLTIDFAEPIKLINKAGSVGIFAGNDALIMLPQRFAADSKTKIVFTYTVNGDTEAPKKVSLSFKDMEWEWGKSYSYQGSFPIDKAEIQLQPTGIAEWQTENPKSEAFSD